MNYEEGFKEGVKIAVCLFTKNLVGLVTDLSQIREECIKNIIHTFKEREKYFDQFSIEDNE